MQYSQLGRTGLSVSRLCLGSLNFGPVTEQAEAHQIMDFALDNGINFLDTSNSYGRHLGRGTAERIIGADELAQDVGDPVDRHPSRGRVATRSAYAHFGLAAPSVERDLNLPLFRDGQ